MAPKKTEPALTTVTPDRAQRLFRLLNLLGNGPQTRLNLTRKLRLAVRGFYRDLEVLRAVGINIKLSNSKYHLLDPLEPAVELLPFPDLSLTLGEARQLSHGRLPVHRKIKGVLEKIEK